MRELKLQAKWEGSSGKVATAANRTREIRPSGMRGGLTETWAMVELGTHRTTERVRIGHSSPNAARVVFLPDRARQPQTFSGQDRPAEGTPDCCGQGSQLALGWSVMEPVWAKAPA